MCPYARNASRLPRGIFQWSCSRPWLDFSRTNRSGWASYAAARVRRLAAMIGSAEVDVSGREHGDPAVGASRCLKERTSGHERSHDRCRKTDWGILAGTRASRVALGNKDRRRTREVGREFLLDRLLNDLLSGTLIGRTLRKGQTDVIGVQTPQPETSVALRQTAGRHGFSGQLFSI